MPKIGSEGNYDDIIISCSNETNISSLKPFSVKIIPFEKVETYFLYKVAGFVLSLLLVLFFV